MEVAVIGEYIGYIAGVFALVGGIYKALIWLKVRIRKVTTELVNPANDSLASRFILLFESHGVHRNQISGFFGHGLTLSDMRSSEALLCKLSQNLLEDAADLFAVNLEWLQGAACKPYPTHSFYKQPAEFERFIDRLISQGNRLDGYVFNSKSHAGALDEYDSAIVVTEEIGHINERSVYRIHICNGWVFSYWKSRGYLAACIAIAWRKGIHLIGKQVDPDWMVRFEEGNTLIGYDYEDGDLKYPAYSTWHADEMVERPEKYLKWVDPERGKFGLQSALRLWLDLDEEGYMQMYFDGSHESVRIEFQKALNE